jgi:hypothetical protein
MEMAESKMAVVVSVLNSMTAEELSNLVPTFNRILKMKRASDALEIAAKSDFKYGDILTWVSNKRSRAGRHYMKFENMNRAHTCVVGRECDAAGNIHPLATKWTVATTMVSKVK